MLPSSWSPASRPTTCSSSKPTSPPPGTLRRFGLAQGPHGRPHPRPRPRPHRVRTLKAVSVRRFGFPHGAQVLQVTRKVCDLATRKWHTVVVYAITSLSFQQARPVRLADLIRGHWMIENGLHWVRDVTFAEDASQLRTGTAPQVMSSLRNLAIGVLSHAGPVNLAAALRRHARDPARPLATLGISLV
jgi:hypothetical protein